MNTYVVSCFQCDLQFDAGIAAWCRCEEKSRTIVCSHCSRCFCRAPVAYKERFWIAAPRSLSGNSNRFRIGDGSIVEHATTRAPRVLIVDDEEPMRALVSCYVEQMGYDVTSVARPKDALELLATTAFDVVITDALMPGMDGREMCLQIKEAYPDRIKVIVMTSLYTANRFKTEARHRFCADEYLAKPLPFGILKAALDRVAPLAPAAV